MRWKYFVAVLVLFISLPTVTAYLDPGSGGYLITALWGWFVSLIAAAFAFAAHYFKDIWIPAFKRFWKNRKVLIATVAGLLFVGILIISVIQLWPKDKILSDYDKLDGVTIYNKSAVFDGYTLVNGTLFDMNGKIVHSWNTGYIGVIDKNGDFYAQSCYECSKWGRYSWNGSIIWEKDFAIHHEILLTERGTVLVLTKEVHSYQGRNVEFDVVLEYDKNGTELSRWSVWDNLEMFQQFHAKLQLDMPQNALLPENHWKNTSIWGGNYDYYHMNSLSLVPPNVNEGIHPAFNSGNWIFSFRHGSMVFLIDKETKNVMWRAIDDQIKSGRLEGPHAAQMLSNGNILVMDNGRYREWSRVLEIDPVSLDVVWEYSSDDFFTLSQGYVQPLDNGNYLVTESEDGRVFEITREKQIVWEWFSSDRWGHGDDVRPEYKGKRKDLYRAIRYSKSQIDSLLVADQ